MSCKKIIKRRRVYAPHVRIPQFSQNANVGKRLQKPYTSSQVTPTPEPNEHKIFDPFQPRLQLKSQFQSARRRIALSAKDHLHWSSSYASVEHAFPHLS